MTTLNRWDARQAGAALWPLVCLRPSSPSMTWPLALGVLTFVTAWLAHLVYISPSPPVDNIEQLTWVRSLEWGYYKHPPLPTWLLWLPVRWGGLTDLTVYSMGAGCTLGAIGLMTHLVARLRGGTHAALALLATLCVTYYNGRLHYYNHNTVLMLMSAASASLCWQAFATPQWRWWIGLGITLGLGALSKYQIAVSLLCVLVFMWQQRGWRHPLHRRGVVLASLIAMLLFMPHVIWLVQHDLGPIHYALRSSLGSQLSVLHRLKISVHWLMDQVLNRAAPAMLLLAASRFWAVPSSWPSHPSDSSPRADAFRTFLLIWGFLPLVFMPLVSLIFGSDLQFHWGTPFLLYTVPAIMELISRAPWTRVNLTKVIMPFVLIQGLTMSASYLTSVRSAWPLREPIRRTFDPHDLAQQVADAARRQLGGPIRIVQGEPALAGSLALKLVERPLVLIEGRFDISPWVSPHLLHACGALRIGRKDELPLGHPIDPRLPDWVWTVIPPSHPSAPCADGINRS